MTVTELINDQYVLYQHKTVLINVGFQQILVIAVLKKAEIAAI